jgi:hypothetical protein
MQYWLSVGDGKSYGPYDVAQLQQMAAEGRVHAQTQLCAVGGSSWVPANSVLSIGGASMAPPSAVALGSGDRWTPVGLAGPVLVTVFCCLIGGIVSIVYASTANSKGAAGDIAGARQAAANSKGWMIGSMVIGIIVSLLYLVGIAIAGARSN